MTFARHPLFDEKSADVSIDKTSFRPRNRRGQNQIRNASLSGKPCELLGFENLHRTRPMYST
jgi:hypothetical protein